MALKFHGLCWKLKVRAKRAHYFVTLVKQIVLGNDLEQGDPIFSYPVTYNNASGILLLFQQPKIEGIKQAQINRNSIVLLNDTV